MKKYEAYKDSGIEWVGVIPEHWEIRRGKESMSFVNGYPFDSNLFTKENSGYLPLIRIRDLFEDKFTTYYTGEAVENAIIENGDILISMDGDFKIVKWNRGKSLLNQRVCKIQSTYFLDISYLYYTLPFYLKIINDLTYYTTVKHLSNKDLLIQSYPCPSIKEQQVIAKYLDCKTLEIDSLVEKKKQLIALLQEERTAIINHAVTKGLDPNVTLKDSGIEWIGEIPEHWESWKIAHAFKNVGSGTTPESGNPLYHDEGTINWLNTGDLNDSSLRECEKKITSKALEDYTSLKLYPAGSLVIAMYGATIGKTAIIEFETTTNQACCVFCESEIVDIKFLQLWFIGMKEHIINLAIGGGQPNISQQILKNIRLFCPSIQEQKVIVSYLEIKIQEISDVITKTKQEIKLIEEYKTALISEVVTGKVDVREEVVN